MKTQKKFKIGDKVKLKDSVKYTGKYPREYIIGSIIWSMLYQDWLYNSAKDKMNGWSTDNLELVENEPKFKVGDFVMIVANNSYDSIKYNGKIGKVISVNPNHWSIEKIRQACGDFYYGVVSANGIEIAVHENDIKHHCFIHGFLKDTITSKDVFNKGDKIITTQGFKGSFKKGESGLILNIVRDSEKAIYVCDLEYSGAVPLPLEYFEKFLVPKFEVGYKFIHTSSGEEHEIIKVALNKKLKSYSYLCYELSSGDSYGVEEKYVIGFKPSKNNVQK